mmetsp:Transcript_151727/g.265140  ORF Transcript_151727/g.265140 Transcript_151727/m.265140 type:complete len:87 (-) Transcript_151727:80-340(-)
MEPHVVPANGGVLEVVAVAKAERGKAVTRNTYSDEVIAEVTQSARHFGSGSKATKALSITKKLWMPLQASLTHIGFFFSFLTTHTL